MVVELHAIVKGKVQGVGFRWTVVDHAEKFHLHGVTRNLSNGSVEIIAQGEKKDLEAFIQTLRDDPGNAKIVSITQEFRDLKQTFSKFSIGT